MEHGCGYAPYFFYERMDIVNNVTPFSSEDKLVAELSESLALACGLSTDSAKLIGDAAALHDVGKNFICKSILNKPEKLTPDEYSIMKTHTIWGVKILSKLQGELRIVAMNVSALHHEKWDGTGYWNRKGDDIPYYCQIVSMCDIYVAVTSSNRPYKEPWSSTKALEYIKSESGKTFCPNLTDTFQTLFSQVA